MGLSSNTLVHLTEKKTSLIGILKEGFTLKYCYEDLTINNHSGIEGAFPMVCFSDIPLSELKNHIGSYGNYGIGLKKEWAKSNRLNPVLYLDQDSYLGGIINDDFEELFGLSIAKTIDPKFFDNLIHILSYTKNYEGQLKTKKIEIDNYRFSDEREWRYIPDKKKLGTVPAWIPISKYNTVATKKKANALIEKIKLEFDPNDINYIFVENEEEIAEFIDIIRKANGKSSYESVERLISRIITTDQIKTDI